MATPTKAFAADGFLGGLQDLVGAREVESLEGYESDYTSDYRPVLGVNPPDPGTNTLTDLGEDATTVDYVNVTLDSFNNSGWTGYGQNSRSLIESIPLLFTQSTMLRIFFSVAVGLVFFWWGVRKALKVLMSGFRKGSMNV